MIIDTIMLPDSGTRDIVLPFARPCVRQVIDVSFCLEKFIKQDL